MPSIPTSPSPATVSAERSKEEQMPAATFWIASGRPAMQAWAALQRVQNGLPLTDWPDELPLPRIQLASPLPTLRQLLRQRLHRLFRLTG